MKRTRYHLFASIIALGTALPAVAQIQPQPAADEQPGRDIVVITANKREETVQDVAVAVTAITSEAKEQLGIISVTDLTNVTPGLSYTPGNERVTLRGIGRLSNSFGADPGVANYNDGIYTGFAIFAGKDPFIIDRVEVLRGPQGTLYGRNAIGGAINTISKRPTEDFQVDLVLGASEFDGRKVAVAVSGPITDSVRYRALAFRESREGIDFNYGVGENEGWEIDDEYLELQLEGDIGDNFTWWLKVADLYYNKAGPPGGRTATFSTAPYLNGLFSTGGLTPNNAYAYGGPNVVSFTQDGPRNDNPFATNREHAYNSNYESVAILPEYDEAIFEAVYSMPTFDIKYVGGYTYYDYLLFSDADGTPVNSITYLSGAGGAPSAAGTPRTIFPGVLNQYEESRSLFSNEVNFISTDDSPLQWIFGLYQYQENSDQPGQVQYLPNEPTAGFYFDTVLGLVANPERELQRFRNVSLFNAYGVYGQIDYAVTDELKATLGLRWSHDNKESREEAFLGCFMICGPTYFNYTRTAYGALPGTTFDNRGVATRRLEDSWEAVTGTAGLEYRPFEDTLIFGKYSRGYKAGGFNNLGFGAAPYTNPEFVDAYEGGWKQEWLDGTLTTNTALFYYSYKDMQSPLTVITGQQGQTGSTTFTAFVNVPEAETAGFELEGNWNPVDPLNIGFTYAYLNAEVSDTGGARYINVARDPRCVGSGGTPVTCSATATQLVDPERQADVTGNKLSQSPEHKVSVNGSYRFDFEDGSWLLPTVSYSWRDEFYDSFFNEASELSPAYGQLDARLNWYSADEIFSLTLWARNITDEEQTTSVSSQAFRVQDLAQYQTFSYTPPRMIGVDLKIHFE